eukprot:5654180-Karenia_brevis.AAC.1
MGSRLPLVILKKRPWADLAELSNNEGDASKSDEEERVPEVDVELQSPSEVRLTDSMKFENATL